MKPEALLYIRIREALGPEWDTQRIENVVGRGCPDITTSHKVTGDIWIEAKAEASRRPLVRPEQYAWMKRRAHLGGKCCVITQEKHEHLWCVWLINDQSIFVPVGSYLIPKMDAWTGKNLADLLRILYVNSNT